MQELSETATDGRAARAIRTRNRVVDGLLDLIDEGLLRPSAAQVASRAGVSLRSVYQHFDDLETLFRVAGERHRQRLAHLEPLPELPASTRPRVAAYAVHRARWMEAVSPMARAAALQAPFSPGIAERQAAARGRHREALAAAFAPELTRAAEPDRLLHALEAAASWSTWETLRTAMALPQPEATAVLERLLLSLLT
ncbi:MAG TPA: TetR/AcrR family transcriptional regulator [Candidatus Dormibacteraeota bacterium]|nr:TetR/AcrR family transcriptional regulator [Candidatus Dormibacteraeota bacterium]